jgi:curli production assembly/transport component CsgF
MKGNQVPKYIKSGVCASLLSLACASHGPSLATELVYFPLNPSFGGSPLNGPVLLNSALATSKHTAPDIGSDRFGIEEKTALQQLNEALERNVINRLVSASASRIVDQFGNFIPGTLETESFTINIVDTLDGNLTIRTIDKLNGGFTEVIVNKVTQ